MWIALCAIFGLGGVVVWLPAWLDAGGPANSHFAMSSLDAQLSDQYHECVPLGWNPQPVAGSYYPAYSAEYRENGVWLHPYWLGRVRRSDLNDPNKHLVYDVMNALVHAGLLQRSAAGDALYYRMTLAATPYYYEANSYGNNPDHLPYLCYSRIVPQAILSRARMGRNAFRVKFAWQVSEAAPWANDRFLRDHSVVLPPLTNPALATFVREHGMWAIKYLATGGVAMLPRAVDVAAWRP